jgi:hypothetical protein
VTSRDVPSIIGPVETYASTTGAPLLFFIPGQEIVANRPVAQGGVHAALRLFPERHEVSLQFEIVSCALR